MPRLIKLGGTDVSQWAWSGMCLMHLIISEWVRRCVCERLAVKQEELVCVSCHQSTLLCCRLQSVFVLAKRVTHTCLSVFSCSLRLSPMVVSNKCFDIKTSNHIWSSWSIVCFSVFHFIPLFYHSFFYFIRSVIFSLLNILVSLGSNYFYILHISITFTILCFFPKLLTFQARCCFLCCVFNVNVVCICRSETENSNQMKEKANTILAVF